MLAPTSDTANQLQEVLFTDAEQYFEHYLHALAQARHSIDLEVYIFEHDALGQRVARALCDAARRQVQVRVMVDGFGINTDFDRVARTLEQAGCKLRIYHPLPWRARHWSFALIRRQQGFQKFWYLLSYLNRRDHRKLLLVDHELCLLGSFNISLKHLPRSTGGQDWRDTGIAINGINQSALRIAFEAIWENWSARMRKRMAKKAPDSPYLLNYTRYLRRDKRKRILGWMTQAQQRIWITNAYFVPDPLLLNTLLDACRRGVDVCLLLPRESDVRFIPWASRYFYTRLLQAGCRIYEYREGILHAKTLLIDQRGIVGSSNLNRRSVFHDLELDYEVQKTATVEALEVAFLSDLDVSEPMQPIPLHGKKRFQSWLGGLVLMLISYWV